MAVDPDLVAFEHGLGDEEGWPCARFRNVQGSLVVCLSLIDPLVEGGSCSLDFGENGLGGRGPKKTSASLADDPRRRRRIAV